MSTIRPLTPSCWPDFEKLFGPRGACGGCWCMWWRLPRAQFAQQQGELNRQNMNTLVASGVVPGLLLYREDQPVGWCSVAPRDHFPVLARSPVLKPVDDQPVWSIVCFFVARQRRHAGVMVELLNAAVHYAGTQGARILEGYPVHPKGDKTPDVFAYTGLFSTFIQAGFHEVARRSETRPIMRFAI